MKSFLLSFALGTLALTTIHLHADTIDLTLLTGSATDALIQTPITYDGVLAEEFTYTNEALCVLGAGGCSSVLGSTTNIFTAIYAQVTPIASVLNVNDACIQVVVLGSAPNCQSFAFSATDITLGNGQLGVLTTDVLALLNVSAGVGSAGITIDGAALTSELAGAGVHGATDNFNFGPPPTPPAATPEPSSLCLLATGLATAAGVVRRRIRATA